MSVVTTLSNKRHQPNNIYSIHDRLTRLGLPIEHLKHRGPHHPNYKMSESDPSYFLYDLQEFFQFHNVKPLTKESFPMLSLLQLEAHISNKYSLLYFTGDTAAHICALLDFFVMDFQGGVPLKPSHIKASITQYAQLFFHDAAAIERARRRRRTSLAKSADKARFSTEENAFSHWKTERLVYIENEGYLNDLERNILDHSLDEYHIGVFLKRHNINLLVAYKNKTCKVISLCQSALVAQWVVLQKTGNTFQLCAYCISPGRYTFIFNDRQFTEFIQEISDNDKILINSTDFFARALSLQNVNPEESILDRIDEKYGY